MSKEKLEIGDHVKYHSYGLNLFAKIVEIELPMVKVIDSESDEDVFDTRIRQYEYIDPSEIADKFVIIPRFSNNYHAVIDFEKKVFIVGCQKIPFEAVKKIYNLISSVK